MLHCSCCEWWREPGSAICPERTRLPWGGKTRKPWDVWMASSTAASNLVCKLDKWEDEMEVPLACCFLWLGWSIEERQFKLGLCQKDPLGAKLLGITKAWRVREWGRKEMGLYSPRVKRSSLQRDHRTSMRMLWLCWTSSWVMILPGRRGFGRAEWCRRRLAICEVHNVLYQSRGGEDEKMQKAELVWVTQSKRSKPKTPGKKCNRNPNAVHVSFWKAVKPEGKISQVLQRTPTVPAATDQGDLGRGNCFTDGVAKLPDEGQDEDHTGWLRVPGWIVDLLIFY